MVYLILFLSIFSDLNSPQFIVRQTHTQTLIKMGIDILPQIDEQLKRPTTYEEKVRLERIRIVILLEEEKKQWKKLKYSDKSTLTGWAEFSSLVGTTKVSRRLYYYLWSVHKEVIKEVLNNKDKDIKAREIYKKYKNKSDWDYKLLWFWFEQISDIDLNIKVYDYGNGMPPFEFEEIFNKVKNARNSSRSNSVR